MRREVRLTLLPRRSIVSKADQLPFSHSYSVQVIRDRRVYSQGFGFVEFERGEDAEEAMKRLNGEQLFAFFFASSLPLPVFRS